MLHTHNKQNISAKALRAAKESLGELIESTAAVAGWQKAFLENSFRDCLQGQKLSLSLPLRNINISSVYLFCRESIFTRKIDILPCIRRYSPGKLGEAYTADDVCLCYALLSAGYLSFKML